ncbi:MAG TPA: ABC transporter permease [Candidatus Paceibacterota bacterium]|nr:ABC transporter permease [Candidatus Paceibacterota bacterium]
MNALAAIRDYRPLLVELVRRDVKTRYTGSLLGLFWSVLNPVLQLVLYTVVFSVFLKVRLGDGDGHGRFAEYLFCALLPWTAIQESWTRSTTGFLTHAHLIKKAPFALEVIPFSYTLSALLHQLAGTAVFLPVLIWRGTLSAESLPWFVAILLVQAVMMVGGGMLLGAANVFIRDVAHVLGVGFMFLFWGTPIVYPKTVVPEPFTILINLNPLTHLVDTYRWAFFGNPSPAWWGILYCAGFSLLVYVLGHRFLRRCRPDLLDLL